MKEIGTLGINKSNDFLSGLSKKVSDTVNFTKNNVKNILGSVGMATILSTSNSGCTTLKNEIKQSINTEKDLKTNTTSDYELNNSDLITNKIINLDDVLITFDDTNTEKYINESSKKTEKGVNRHEVKNLGMVKNNGNDEYSVILNTDSINEYSNSLGVNTDIVYGETLSNEIGSYLGVVNKEYKNDYLEVQKIEGLGEVSTYNYLLNILLDKNSSNIEKYDSAITFFNHLNGLETYEDYRLSRKIGYETVVDEILSSLSDSANTLSLNDKIIEEEKQSIIKILEGENVDLISYNLIKHIKLSLELNKTVNKDNSEKINQIVNFTWNIIDKIKDKHSFILGENIVNDVIRKSNIYTVNHINTKNLSYDYLKNIGNYSFFNNIKEESSVINNINNSKEKLSTINEINSNINRVELSTINKINNTLDNNKQSIGLISDINLNNFINIKTKLITDNSNVG